MSFLPFCWLVPGDPGPFPAPFNRTFDDFERFKKWFTHLTSIKNPEKKDAIQAIVLTYETIKKENTEIFSINCIEVKPRTPLHQRMRVDILNTIYKIKKYHDLPLSPPINEDIIENIIGRILVYAHLNGIEYHKGFCELVLPIMHVYYYGVLQSEVLEYSMPFIEAIVADSFVRLMSSPLYNHYDIFPPSKSINSLLNQLIEYIKPYQIYQMIKNGKIEPQFFASRWIKTIFIQDIDFSEVIKIWDYLFEKSVLKISSSQSLSLSQSSLNSSQKIYPSSSMQEISHPFNKFHHNITLLCAACVLEREQACKELNAYEYLEKIQEIDDLTAETIISRIKSLNIDPDLL